ncbi:MAG TPA: hypothetical protein VHZ54_06765 [Solirubrobacterales bacterium]|jgi:hypothetical protein|nr:hypothetical protein [Solirubrobacterales bacterium]
MSRAEPSRAEIKAVRKAVGSRNVHIEDHFISIQTLLHITGNSSEGPPDPESEGREELISRCEKLASEIRKVRTAVGVVDFDAGAKRDLRAALDAAASGWDARAELFATLDLGKIERAQQAAERSSLKAETFTSSLRPYFEAR